MEELKSELKRILADTPTSKILFRRNILKEYLQVVVLDYIFSHPVYSQLVFYGGSCLAQCYGLPRLSEDLDFVDLDGSIDTSILARDLKEYFKKKTDLEVSSTLQKFRITLKFPILHELGLGSQSDSNLLTLKIEVFRDDGLLRHCPVEKIPLFKFNRSLIVRTFDLPTLMATKIRAVLHRKWEKRSKSGGTLAVVKGRDYFDLMWYLRKGILPNMKCITEAKDIAELKNLLMAALEKVDPASIKYDLYALIADDRYVEEISGGLIGILKSEIEKLK